MVGRLGMLNRKNSVIRPFSIGFLVMFFPVFIIAWKVLRYTHGVFMYPFDDTFIHLTIADNLLKGNWGINENEFASASSSILYTLLLALFRLFSNSSTIPFVVNCLSGFFILIAVHFWLKKHLVNSIGQSFVFVLISVLAPLPLLIISGMEHTLQCLFSFLFIFYFSDWLEESNQPGKRRLPLKILLFAILVSTIRYEGVFLIAIACVLLLVYRNVFSAFILAVVSLMPLIIFGMIALNKGNYFFPNSVLVKSGSFNFSGPVRMLYDILFERLTYARNGLAALATQRLLIILPLIYLVFKKYLRPSYFFVLLFLFGAAILQLAFASTGYLYRYEAYLFFCSAIILPVIFYKYQSVIFEQLTSIVSRFVALILVFFLIFPVALRSSSALDKTARACINIYEQQYQMAMFSKCYYNENVIALNDIGAVGYFTDAKIIDLWGLANSEVTRSKKQHYWAPHFLDSLCKVNKTTLAIIYDSWFPDSLMKKWSKIATWQIQNNVICGDSMVSFYALNPSAKDLIQQQLRLFEHQIPASVLITYY